MHCPWGRLLRCVRCWVRLKHVPCTCVTHPRSSHPWTSSHPQAAASTQSLHSILGALTALQRQLPHSAARAETRTAGATSTGLVPAGGGSNSSTLGFDCNACTSSTCPAGQYRSGACGTNSTTNRQRFRVQYMLQLQVPSQRGPRRHVWWHRQRLLVCRVQRDMHEWATPQPRKQAPIPPLRVICMQPWIHPTAIFAPVC